MFGVFLHCTAVLSDHMGHPQPSLSGTGVLWVSNGNHRYVDPRRQGGGSTMSQPLWLLLCCCIALSCMHVCACDHVEHAATNTNREKNGEHFLKKKKFQKLKKVKKVLKGKIFVITDHNLGTLTYDLCFSFCSFFLFSVFSLFLFFFCFSVCPSFSVFFFLTPHPQTHTTTHTHTPLMIRYHKFCYLPYDKLS